MSQLFGDAGNIRPVGNGNAGEGVAQLVRVEVLNTVAVGELLHVAGGAGGEHRLRAIVLREHPLGDELLLPVKQLCQLKDFGVNVDGADAAALSGGHIKTSFRRVVDGTANGDRVLVIIEIVPLQAAALATPDAGVSHDTDVKLPFQ